MAGNSWLHIDERLDVLISLSACLKAVNAAAIEPGQWKWAVLSLHSALNGAMVCHLSGTAQLGALSAKSISASLEWHDRDRRGEIEWIDLGRDEMGILQQRLAKKGDNPPREHLADSKELFQRLYKANKRCEGGAGTILDISNSQKDSFRRLHNLRNEFAHFTPKGWSIEISGLPRIFGDTLDVIEKIYADPWAFRHIEEEEKAQLLDLTDKLRISLDALRR